MNPEFRPLPGYVRIDRGFRSALIHPDFEPYLSAALFEGRGVQASPHAGRAPMTACPTPLGTVLIRQCRRGGALGPLLRDRYFLVNRPLRELQVHREVHARGVPAVLPVAAYWQRSGLFVRGSMATLEVDGEDLLAHIRWREKPDPEALAACGRAIRAMHAAGVLHADLQLKNLLVRGDRAWIIDFDKARFAGDVGGLNARDNFQRLRRSFLKHAVPILYFDAILDAYKAAGGVEVPL